MTINNHVLLVLGPVLLSSGPGLLSYLLSLGPVLLNLVPFTDLPHASCLYTPRDLNVPSF